MSRKNKKFSPKQSNTPVKPEQKDIPMKEKDFYNPSGPRRNFLLGLPLFGAFIIFFIWFEFYKPNVINDWDRSSILIDSAAKTVDPIVKKKLLDDGGNILRKQISLHPYHARIWFMYGYYFILNNNWDSSIYAEKKAIELGAGGIVNNIEYAAAENLNYALERKLSEIHTLDSSIRVIDNARTNNFENNLINKLKGFTFYKYNQFDSCNFYLELFYSKVKNDFDVLSGLAYSYSRIGMKDKALFYAAEAKKIKNDNVDLNNLINYLNSR